MRLFSRFAPCSGLFVLLAIACPAVAAEKPAVPSLGVYRWANQQGNVDAFAQWLGRDVVWGLDFVGGETWDNVGWPTWWLEAWGKWVNAKPGRRLVLSIPILAGPPDGSGPTGGNKGVGERVSLKKGATGDYNHHFRDLAENLVRYKLADTILRPGWEFNGGWYAWKAKGQQKEFIAYWRQIVTTMRSVKGAEKLQFCWNPTLGDQDFPADEAWPGDEYVDYVGVDVYDETWIKDAYPWPAGSGPEVIAARQKKAWDEWIIHSPRGLKFWSQFARDHNKPLAIPEWGLNAREDGFGGMDNVHFIEQMHAFITDPANRVAFHCYFDVNSDSNHRHQLSPGRSESGEKADTFTPKAAARFRELFRS